MRIDGLMVCVIFFLLFVQPKLFSIIGVAILCIPLYMFWITVFDFTGGRAPNSPRQGGDRNANSGENEQ